MANPPETVRKRPRTSISNLPHSTEERTEVGDVRTKPLLRLARLDNLEDAGPEGFNRRDVVGEAGVRGSEWGGQLGLFGRARA